MIVSLIVAMAENRVIGMDGKMPWHLPGELELFKRRTMGKPVIMGRKTWESLGRALPGRANIVITRQPGYLAPGGHAAASLSAALALAEDLAGGAIEAMIIGGAEIYAQALPLARRIYLTEVHAAPEGDVLFPEFDPAEWRETERRDFPGEGEAPSFSVTVLERTA